MYETFKHRLSLAVNILINIAWNEYIIKIIVYLFYGAKVE